MNRIIGRHLLAFVLASIVALPAPRLHAAANPVATYAFNETSGPTTVDGSGNGFTGTLTNSPTFVAGKYGNALSFNATDDGNDSNDPRVGLGRTINVPNLPFTFSAWVNPASYADWRAIFSKRDSPSSSNRRLDVGLASGSGRVYLATGATTRTFAYGAPLNVWTHLTVVAETGGTKLYVNGVLRETLAAITLGTNTNANTVIGGTGEGTPGDNDPFKGMIDDVRLYARALTQSEIDSDMNTSAGVPDTEFPTVAMTAPAAGTVSGTSVTVSANASDNVAVAGVQFQLDGVNLGAEDTSAPYSIVWNSVTATNAAHTLTAIARDAAGNATTSAGVAVTVSNPPVLVITQPTNGATTSGTSVNITYTTTGNLTGVSHVHFVLDSNPQVMDLSFDGAYTMANVLPGAHVLNGFLVNSSHVKIPGSDAAPVNFTSTAPDTIPPTGVAITSPAASSTLSGTVTITADATDNTGVVGVQFRIGAQNITPEDTSAPYSVSFNTLTVPNGAYTLTAVARDAAGNQTTSPGVSVTITNVVTGLVAVYAFDEAAGGNAYDGSGNGFTGNLSNNPVWATGKYGGALQFNATDDGNDSNDPKVLLGRTLDIPTLPFTFSAWVNPASFADWRAIFSKRDGPGAASRRFDIGLGSSTGRVYVSTGSTNRIFAYIPPLNAWTHLAVVAEATGTKLYVNGVLNQTLAAVTLGTSATASVAIGGTGAGSDNDPYKGLIDDLRLYARALTPLEIASDMNTPAGAPDTEAPSVSLTAPAAGTVSGTAVTVSANASDNVIVAGVQFQLDGVNIGAEDTSAPYSIVWNSITATNDVHTLTAVARDAMGNTATSAGVVVTVSNPPTMVITQPVNGATIAGTTVDVTYTVGGNLTGVDHVHFQLDSNPIVMDIDMDGVYQFTNVPAGSHVLNAFLVNEDHIKVPGTDAAPVAFSTNVTDGVPPNVAITSPSPGTSVSGTITITADASDNTGVLGVLFRVGGVDIIPEDLTAPYSTSFNTTTVANGTYVLTAIARDAAGNQTTSAGVSITVANSTGSTDPAVIGSWGPRIGWPSVAIHATLMDNGNVLTWDDHAATGGANVWNPTTGVFTPVPYNKANLFCSGHTSLADGRILVNGGNAASYIGIKETAIFNPVNNTWTTVDSMDYGRWYPSTITLSDGRVLTVSGAINCDDCIVPGGPDAGIAEIPEVFNPVTNLWSPLTNAPLNLPIYPYLYVLPDGRVLVTSTQEDPVPTYALDIATQTWTVIDPVVVDGGCSVQYRPGKFLKSGMARNPDYPQVSSHARSYVLDMTSPSPSWRQTPDMAFPRTQHNLTMLPDGNVLVTGGALHSNYFDLNAGVFEAELWNPTTETYTTLARAPRPRIYHSTATLLPDGRVLTAGGEGVGDTQFSGELYSPPYLFKGPRPTMSGVPSLLQYGSSFSISTPNAASIAKVSLIKLTSVTHAFNSEQRFLPLTFVAGSGSLTIQAPANSNLATPGYYMLFIVDTNGVPSVGAFCRFPSPADDSEPPTAPSNLTANGTIGAASLSWTASSDNLGVTAYDVHRATTNPFTPSLANKVGSTSQTSFVNSGVSPGSYFYLVLARDAAGNTSQPSNIAGATVLADTQAPSTPTGLAATAISESRIDLTWNASTDNVGVTGYNVIRDGIQIGTTAQTSFSNTGLTASTTYAYQVAAFDAAGNPSAPSTPPVNRSTLAAPPPSSNLVAAYAFDEGPGATTTADASGNGFTGTLVNNPTWGTGKYGAGLVFNATDDGNDANDPRVVIGRTVNVPGLPFTFSAWVNPASFTDWRAILSKRDTASSSNRRFDVGLAASSGRVYVATGATTRTFVYGAPINTWTHIAVVAEATGTKLYVNGVLRETLAAITLGANSNANTVIGGTGEGAGGDNDPFKGSLDDLRLYSRAQTAAEITTDMNTPVTAAPAAQTLPLVASQMGVSPTPPAPPVLRVFPNPFRSGTRIEARGGQDVIVFDVTGRKVRRWRSPSTLSVDWEGTDGEGRRLPAGIYFVKSGRHIVRAVLLR